MISAEVKIPKFYAQDLSGAVFGRLTVLRRAACPGNPRWVCICECGKEHITTSSSLKSGDTKSCGCARIELRTKHSMCGTTEYHIWSSMLNRCKKNRKGYENITVCKRWRDSFSSFYADMGPRPKDRTLDRINPNKNYTPKNCRWADLNTQARNRRGKDIGIVWVEKKKKYRVQIGVNGKTRYVGLTTSIKEARKMRKQAEKEYWNGNIR
jgi:hypothetical protein